MPNIWKVTIRLLTATFPQNVISYVYMYVFLAVDYREGKTEREERERERLVQVSNWEKGRGPNFGGEKNARSAKMTIFVKLHALFRQY